MNRQVLEQTIKKRSPNKDPTTTAFRVFGRTVAEIVAKEIRDVFGNDPAIAVLEFGAGSGRVAAPLATLLPMCTIEATDVDEEAVAYMRLTAPLNLRALMNSYRPPLPYPAESFDCVYAISVWSHLPKHLGYIWLEEMYRVTKPGGLVVITVAGLAALTAMQVHSPLVVRDITPEALGSEKFIYREMPNLRSPGLYPGISGSWGNTFIHPDYVQRAWSEIFEISHIREGGLPGKQDIVVMRRSSASFPGT